MPDQPPPVPIDDIDDIEDIVAPSDPTPRDRFTNRKHITVKAKRRSKTPPASALLSPVPSLLSPMSPIPNLLSPTPTPSTIPGTQSIYIKTWGCAHNSSDSEYMAGQLAAYGYRLTPDKSAADLWLLNGCTVKGPSEAHFRNELEAARALRKPLVLAGCVPQAAPRAPHLAPYSVVGVQQIDRVVEVVEETLKGHTVRFLAPKRADGRKLGGAALHLPKVRRNPLIEIIAISTGCLNQCTYCKTRHARGELGSYPVEAVVARARQAIAEGVVEVWITSEDTGAYGRDIGATLPELLWRVVEEVPAGCRLRLGMTNPPYILEHLAEMARIMRHERVYRFLHVPVQSGSDRVLADMKREYCRADFERVVDYLSGAVGNMTIATDIICGFPTETEEDFEETMALCRRYEFKSLFINQFYPRPGTPAARMARVDPREVKGRTRRLTELFYGYEPFRGRVGEVQEVLVTEVSHDKRHFVGHNASYEQVLIAMDEACMGKLVMVRIVGAGKFSMVGEVISGRMPGLRRPLEAGQVSGLKMEKVDYRVVGGVVVLGVAIFLRVLWLVYRW